MNRLEMRSLPKMKSRSFPLLPLFVASLLSGCMSPTGPVGLSSDPEPQTALENISARLERGLIQNAIADPLPSDVLARALSAEYRALEYQERGQQVSWESPDKTIVGTVMPLQPYRVGSQDCRQYVHNLTVKGVPRSATGAACRNEDGSWTLI